MTTGFANSPEPDDATVALMALSWILQDQSLADRFLALTGFSPHSLRTGIGTREVQGAVLDFLAGNEGDLIAAADTLGLAPERIVAARDNLFGRNEWL
ncbi:DUF3572 domain-containing protein [Croceicoccus naphthovorans]|uniref:Uncharacterized protein n=1 Tax=Croceicoccus naphthovorans TaxID=1348774 RepID=A0A0G3XDM8_9SPHN|nr:DUF3572 domain-containing protein [Croceicoccus naphthovorans]AKM09297.1 hypothetical protein AB433_03780 [Croceicoccus naphthovorans]MBB3990200.1 hypothetical protein [Croceicoccus naphthovorans]